MEKSIKITGREDLLIKTPTNGLIKDNITNTKVKESVVIDSGMRDVLQLFWSNNIQTRGCCHGHIENSKECIAWIDVCIEDFAKACQLAKEIQFDKPLGVSCSCHKIVFFNKRDFEELGNWNIFPLQSYMIFTSGE